MVERFVYLYHPFQEEEEEEEEEEDINILHLSIHLLNIGELNGKVGLFPSNFVEERGIEAAGSQPVSFHIYIKQ